MSKKRTKHRNGDSIHLHTGCNSCSPARINGVLCHEGGCPDAWKDKPKECSQCGCTFYHPRFRTCHRHKERF